MGEFKRSEKMLERSYVATHEAGHYLIFLLDRQSIKKACVHTLRGETCAHLSVLLGSDKIKFMGREISLNAGESSLGEEVDKRYNEDYPAKSSIMYAAGIANTFSNPEYGQYMQEVLSDNLLRGRFGVLGRCCVPM